MLILLIRPALFATPFAGLFANILHNLNEVKLAEMSCQCADSEVGSLHAVSKDRFRRRLSQFFDTVDNIDAC